MADTLPLEVSEMGAFAGDRTRVLPQWAAALPLWAGGRWIWLRVGPAHTLRYWQGSTRNHLGTGETAGLEQVPLTPPYPVIVLDYHAVPAVLPRWWPALATALAPGGVLFICGPRQPQLSAQIQGLAPALAPAAWHLIELGQDADWHLRPATVVSQQLIDTELQPPLSLSAWLAQLRRRWLPVGQRVSCLPVWRREEHA